MNFTRSARRARSGLRLAMVLCAVGVVACTVTGDRDGSAGVAAAKGADVRTAQWGFGRAPSAAELAAVDIDVGPGGDALPAGSGNAVQGKALYATQCAGCHGTKGEGIAKFPALIGRSAASDSFQFAEQPALVHTIGNYWPHAYTVFDYIRRAMPHGGAGRLTDNENYAVTAWLLAANQVIADTATLDATTLRAVTMPAEKRFVRDDRRGGNEVR